MTLVRSVLLGTSSGAAGTTALNAVTFLDMALRGRPASRTPQDTVARVAGSLHIGLGTGATRESRLSGLGSLGGTATGVAVGTAYGLAHALGIRPPRWAAAELLTAAALAAGNLPLVLSGMSDPREWSVGDWLADVVPHVA